MRKRRANPAHDPASPFPETVDVTPGAAPYNNGGTLSTPCRASRQRASLSIVSGIPTQPRTPNPLAGRPYLLLRIQVSTNSPESLPQCILDSRHLPLHPKILRNRAGKSWPQLILSWKVVGTRGALRFCICCNLLQQMPGESLPICTDHKRNRQIGAASCGKVQSCQYRTRNPQAARPIGVQVPPTGTMEPAT